MARDQLAVVHATREAARAAAVSTDLGDGAAAGRAAADLPGLEIQLSTEGDQVVATAQRTVPTEVPLVGRLLPDIVVRARAVMRVEG